MSRDMHDVSLHYTRNIWLITSTAKSKIASNLLVSLAFWGKGRSGEPVKLTLPLYIAKRRLFTILQLSIFFAHVRMSRFTDNDEI